MHNRIEPSLFFTNNTGAPHDDTLGLYAFSFSTLSHSLSPKTRIGYVKDTGGVAKEDFIIGWETKSNLAQTQTPKPNTKAILLDLLHCEVARDLWSSLFIWLCLEW